MESGFQDSGCQLTPWGSLSLPLPTLSRCSPTPPGVHIIPQPLSPSPCIPKPVYTYPTLPPLCSPHLLCAYLLSELYTAPQKWAKASESHDTVTSKRSLCSVSSCWNTWLGKSEWATSILSPMPWALKVLRGKQPASQINPVLILDIPCGWRTKKSLAFAEE